MDVTMLVVVIFEVLFDVVVAAAVPLPVVVAAAVAFAAELFDATVAAARFALDPPMVDTVVHAEVDPGGWAAGVEAWPWEKVDPE
jgi:hypothetical protein